MLKHKLTNTEWEVIKKYREHEPTRKVINGILNIKENDKTSRDKSKEFDVIKLIPMCIIILLFVAVLLLNESSQETVLNLSIVYLFIQIVILVMYDNSETIYKKRSPNHRHLHTIIPTLAISTLAAAFFIPDAIYNNSENCIRYAVCFTINDLLLTNFMKGYLKNHKINLVGMISSSITIIISILYKNYNLMILSSFINIISVYSMCDKEMPQKDYKNTSSYKQSQAFTFVTIKIVFLQFLPLIFTGVDILDSVKNMSYACSVLTSKMLYIYLSLVTFGVILNMGNKCSGNQ